MSFTQKPISIDELGKTHKKATGLTSWTYILLFSMLSNWVVDVIDVRKVELHTFILIRSIIPDMKTSLANFVENIICFQYDR